MKDAVESGTTVRFRGHDYAQPAHVEARSPEALSLAPTQERVRERQVFLPPTTDPAVTPAAIYLQRGDGSFTRYSLEPR